jgi:putative spermidine/putrescine transport system permease protein
MTRKISITFLLLIFLQPLLVLLYLSFSTQWHYPSLFAHPFTTQHWQTLLSESSALIKSIGISIMISTLVSFVATGMGFFISRGIAYYTKSRWWLTSAYFPYVIAPVVLAVMLNFYFLKMGLTGTFAGILLAQLLITIPYSVIFFHSFWSSTILEREYLVATLGGNFMTSLRHAILPSAKGLLVVCYFQCYLISWFEYGLTQYIGVGKVETLTILVYRYISEANPYLAALAGLLLLIPPLVLLFVNRSFFIQNVWKS